MKKELYNRIAEQLKQYKHSDKPENLTIESILTVIKEELPDFNPYKIDEERMEKLYESTYTKDWDCSTVKLMTNKYNSTVSKGLKPLPSAEEFGDELLKCFENNYSTNDLVDYLISKYELPTKKSLPEGLKPLPKEMPDGFMAPLIGVITENGRQEIWDWVVNHYGTPEQKPSLPSVEELEKEIATLWGKDIEMIQRGVAKYFHDKYSLKQSEWWQDCEKFMHNGVSYRKYSHQVYPDGRTFLHSELSRHDLQYCTPYTAPTADEIIKKHNLTEEEIRLIREGK